MAPDQPGHFVQERSRVGRLPKAVIDVDMHGRCADYDHLLAICAAYDSH